MPERNLIVLGLGNVLMGDDGLGVRAVERLARRFAPDGATRVLDGGTLGLALLPYLEDAEEVLLVDAVRTRGAPGELVRMEAEEIAPNFDVRLSPHEIGVVDLLRGASLSGRRPEVTVLLGIVPAQVEFGVHLSRAVEQALPKLVDRIVAEAEALGHRFTPVPA